MKYPQAMPLLYDKPHDLETRLGGAVYMYKGEPYRMYFDGAKVIGEDIQTGERKLTLASSDVDIDISSIELGYMNYDTNSGGTRAVYLTRRPCKQWKQGVCSNNIMTLDYDGQEAPYSRDSIVCSKGFYDLCIEKYPAFKSMFKLKSKSSMALSRSIAVHRNDLGVFGVYLRCKPIGYFDVSGKTFNKSPGLPEWFVEEVVKNDLAVS